MAKRYYFHGDLRSPQCDHFCVFCDSFEPDFFNHIAEKHPKENGRKRFLWSKKRFKTFMLNTRGEFYRPASADITNLAD